MGLMKFDITTIVLNVANVLIFFAAIRAFFWKPIMNIMEKRQQMINEDLAKAKEQNEEAQGLKQQYESALADAKEEAKDIIETARKRSADERDAAVKQTQEETAKMIADAQQAIEADRNKAMQGMQAEIATIAMAAASKVISNNIDEEANKKYLDEFLGEAGGK